MGIVNKAFHTFSWKGVPLIWSGKGFLGFFKTLNISIALVCNRCFFSIKVALLKLDSKFFSAIKVSSEKEIEQIPFSVLAASTVPKGVE